MTAFLTILFWTGLLLLLYTYIGYALVLTIISWFRRSYAAPHFTDDQLPDVTVLIAAYNEEDFIEDKINNTLSLDYPMDKLSVFIVSDGSTDHTPQIVKKIHAVKLFHETLRKGKIHAVNRVMKAVTTPIVIFTDANTLLSPQSLKNIVRHYQDPQVGGVAGEKRIIKRDSDNPTGSGEGVYWKYESWLKKKDSDVNSIVGAAGELFSIRTELYEDGDENAIIEDFLLSMGIAARGYRFIYEREACATETASVSIREEWKRKVRICTGGFQAIARLKHLLNPLKYGMLSFQYISHRVLRWTLAPISLPLVLVSNIWLAAATGSSLYSIMLTGQVGFYLLAFLGYVMRERKISIKGFFVPYYFVIMNLAVFAGFKRFLLGQQSVIWDKAARASMHAESIKT